MSLNFPFRKTTSDLSNLNCKQDLDYEFSKAINLFKAQREKLGLSLESLSNKTKISKNVLIAIENGWKKYLPETTYLTSMLKILEIEINLEQLRDQNEALRDVGKFWRATAINLLQECCDLYRYIEKLEDE